MALQLDNWIMNTQEVAEIERNLSALYGTWLRDRSLRVSASADASGAYIQVLVKNEAQSFYYPIEGRMNLSDFKESAKEATLIMIDYVSSYLEEYFKESENVFLPIDWADFEVEGIVFQLKGQVKNMILENIADQILTGSSVDQSGVEGLKIENYLN